MAYLDYKVDSRGMITSPGKFEGQCRYVPYFWDVFLDGFADADDGKVLSFYVTAEDKKMFPELRRRKAVKLVETDQGFVVEI